MYQSSATCGPKEENNRQAVRVQDWQVLVHAKWEDAQLIQVMVTCGEWRGGRSPGQGRVPTAGVGRLIAAVVLWRIGFRRRGGIDQYPD